MVAQNDIAMGFGRMGEFDAALNLYMRQNNIKSLNAKNAGQLGLMKQQYTAELRTQFPGWAESVDTLDKGRTTRQFEQIAALVTDPPPKFG